MSDKNQKKQKKLYTIWCERDIGQHSVLFQSEDSAYDWLKENWDEYKFGHHLDAIKDDLVVIKEFDSIGQKNLTSDKIRIKLIRIFGSVINNGDKCTILWWLDIHQAIKYCKGNQRPIVIETFEGSNIHIEAINNGDS